MNMLTFPMLAGGKREGKGRGESIHPSTPAQGLLSGIPYASWWRVRERKGEVPFGEREKLELSRFSRRSF
jgi:hypothetical protein